MPQTVWRIAPDTPEYGADDLSGKGAERTGGRWNRQGTAIIYAAVSASLACLETLVRLTGARGLPLNRYLVTITIPTRAWRGRKVFEPSTHVGWDAEPAGLVSLNWGTSWLDSNDTLVAAVPSVIVPEDINVLINPRHPDAKSLTVKKLRRWTYDMRLA